MVTGNTFDKQCSEIRGDIKAVGIKTFALKNSLRDIAISSKADAGEMAANVTIAYRHLEDAAMRLGKAIQAFEGGANIYDSNDAERVAKAGAVGEGGHFVPQGGNIGGGHQGE